MPSLETVSMLWIQKVDDQRQMTEDRSLIERTAVTAYVIEIFDTSLAVPATGLCNEPDAAVISPRRNACY